MSVESAMALLLSCLVILAIFPSCVQARRGRNDTLYLALSGAWTGPFSPARDLACGFLVGFETIKERQILPGYKFEYQARDSNCNPRTGMKIALDMWSSMAGLDVIFIDSCSVVCQPLGLLSAAWNIPSLSNFCTSDALSDTDTYPTFSRVIGGYITYIPVISKVAESLNFTDVAIITETADLYKLMAEYGKGYFESQGQTVIYKTFKTTVDLINGKETLNLAHLEEMKIIIKDLKNKVRFLVLLMYITDIRHFLILADEQGMLNGEYIYHGTDMYPTYSESPTWRPDISDDYLFRGYLAMDVSLDLADNYKDFRQRCWEAYKDPFYKPFPKPPSIDWISIHSAMIHDAVLMWAIAVNKTITAGFSPDDGFQVAGNMHNSTFYGMTGSVIIDDRGDRTPNYVVEIIQSRKPIPILEWRAEEKIMLKKYKPDQPFDWSGILWPGNGTALPKNSPPCGWNGELCVNDVNNLPVIVGPTVGVFCLAIIITVLVFRRVINESKLREAMTYVLPWKEIHLIDNKNHSSSRLTMETVQTTEAEIMVAQNVEKARVQNDIAVVKRIGRCSADLTDRRILSELKDMKDTKHDNVNSFLGVCLETPSCCILMRYAPKGSLQDIFNLEELRLTWDFKLSILNDIASGMRYLQSCEIGHHGHLTSSNCVIDGRWVCKITDYGLRYLQSISQLKQDEKIKNADAFLWTAPEHLRKPNSEGSKKGDVYSFGIIVQEVVLEGPPYCENSSGLTAEETVYRVKKGERPPFRPAVSKDFSNEKWVSLMNMCWHEDASERPGFDLILAAIRKINGGASLNLVDNMIRRLENHTQNLEEIVNERTYALHEEKHKVEQLLMELLPRTVADKLKAGIQIKPESFESTTIFFSDVVSFTRISAAGTPIDVVRMLNWMYTMFDDVSAEFDVYKVATIGDAYFVASGVPIRNGDNHAAEICGMAVQLLKCMNDFYIPHIPNETLKLRIGVHSGSCVAGVAGIKMPRYLLFGDTIDIASRLEAQGESMRIHVSQSTADLLNEEGGFSLEKRGRSEIKGLGYVHSYWLNKV